MDTTELLAAARGVAAHAYSPYSTVRVGAALEAADGRVFLGCNVENASYGLTICAERNALARAVAEGAADFVRVAIWSSLENPLPPCGACRQVLAEFAPGLEVVWSSDTGPPLSAPLGELLGHMLQPGDVRGHVGERDR